MSKVIEPIWRPDGVNTLNVPLRIKVGTFEESGMDAGDYRIMMDAAIEEVVAALEKERSAAEEWREKYEELLQKISPIIDEAATVGDSLVLPLAENEVAIKPHKRHKPRKRDSTPIDVHESVEVMENCVISVGVTDSPLPTTNEPLAHPQSEPEGTDPVGEGSTDTDLSFTDERPLDMAAFAAAVAPPDLRLAGHSLDQPDSLGATMRREDESIA